MHHTYPYQVRQGRATDGLDSVARDSAWVLCLQCFCCHISYTHALLLCIIYRASFSVDNSTNDSEVAPGLVCGPLSSDGQRTRHPFAFGAPRTSSYHRAKSKALWKLRCFLRRLRCRMPRSSAFETPPGLSPGNKEGRKTASR